MFFGGRPKEKGCGAENSNSDVTGAHPATAKGPLGDAEGAKSAQPPTNVMANAATSTSCAAEPESELDHEEAKRCAAAAREVSATFGEVVALLMRTPPYRELWLTDLEWLVVPALLKGQISVATTQSSTNGATMTVGAVLWAHVSDEVDKRLICRPQETIRLSAKEWTSGDIVWVVASAGDGRVLGEMLKRLSTKEWAGKDVRIMVRGKDGRPTVANLAARGAEAA
jgi:cytolysin-activating lysine-acyltransferase